MISESQYNFFISYGRFNLIVIEDLSKKNVSTEKCGKAIKS